MTRVFGDPLAEIGDHVVVGKAFAFFLPGALESRWLGWLRKVPGVQRRGLVVPLVGSTGLGLPGALVEAPPLGSLRFAAISTDKALYREGRDSVRALVVDVGAPRSEVTVVVRANGAEATRRSLRLDARGAGMLTLSDLPAARYELSFADEPDEPAAAFDVAEYRLAPLVASMTSRRFDGKTLSFELRVESFGVPVQGKVRLELVERQRRLAKVDVPAVEGVVRASFALSGDGPHAINVQLVDDPARTATVPIVGSRATERSTTVLSGLGTEVACSMLPTDGARPVRGLYLQDGATTTTPIALERVDTDVARLTCRVALEALTVVLVDPTFPARASDAVDVATATHPSHVDPRYAHAEKLFHEGKWSAARLVLEEALRAASGPMHPYYAYCVACCFAREGDPERALGMLRRSVREGWSDLRLLATDDDLASLHGRPDFEALVRGGQRVLVLEDVPAGRVLEVPIDTPTALLVLGAFVQGRAWEGWATVVRPIAAKPTLSLAQEPEPGQVANIVIDTGVPAADASVYVVVKDARLASTDTPESRLAARIKKYADRVATELWIGHPERRLTTALPSIPPGFAFGGMPAMPVMMAAAPAAFAEGMEAPTRAFARSRGASEPPFHIVMPTPAGPVSKDEAPAADPYRSALPVRPSVEREPEVLFAGFVEPSTARALGPSGDGSATADAERSRLVLPVTLVEGPADYVIEAFVIRGGEWAQAEHHFHAERDVFAALELPAFVHADDGAFGRVHVGSKSGGRVVVTRDGAPLPVAGLAADGSVPVGKSELRFVARPGKFEVTLIEHTGKTASAGGIVEPLGKLRRLSRPLHLLEPGQSLSKERDPNILALRVMPALDRPLQGALDATADYGHACCEQTAAKILAACLMYVLAVEPSRRARAEAIILAGITRERRMWLRGRGFKMYPESADEPSDYWSPKAARHLTNLALLRELTGAHAPSGSLATAVDEGLAMASDVVAAHRLPWPPTDVRSCEDAYAALRFGSQAAPRAVEFVRRQPAPVVSAKAPFGGIVAARAEAAYGAAALLRARSSPDRSRALSLSNFVLRDLNPEGMLYSTVDSVALIALFAELQAARLVGSEGLVEIDGRPMTVARAAECDDATSVLVTQGVAAVEVTTIVEEDWDAFASNVDVAVSLRNAKGKPVKSARPGEALSLVVENRSRYKAGDVCWVCLPDALSRIVGGGQVKRFSLDFEGRDEVQVPLAVTSTTVGPDGASKPSHLAVLVRNMFEEERAGNPGPVPIEVRT